MTKSSLLFIMFHIINKDDNAVINCCVYIFCYGNENYESRCIVIKSVSLNMASKNIAKYTVSFLTLGYILNSSIPITSKMDENFHSLDKDVSIVSSEVCKPQCKNDCDSIIETVENKIKCQKIQTETNLSTNNHVDEVIRKLQIQSENKKLQNKVFSESSPKVNIKTAKNKSKQKSEGLVLVGYATAYTAGANARMANGQKPIEGVHCAMNKKYKGCRVKVTIGNEVRYYDVDDTGPLKNGVIIDIYMKGRKKCLDFGRRKVKVEFVPRRALN